MIAWIYPVTGLIITGWSIWLFILWQKKLAYSDTSPLRFTLLLLPLVFFLAIVFSDWSRVVFLRIDILGLILIGAGTLVLWILQAAAFTLPLRIYRYIYLSTIIIHFVFNLMCLATLFALKSFPLLALRIAGYFETWQHIDLFRTVWEGLDPEKYEQSISGLVNKILIALVLYFPLTLVRLWYTNYKFRQIKQELAVLRKRLDTLSGQADHAPSPSNRRKRR